MNDTLSVAVICTPNNRANIPRNAIDSIIVQTVRPKRLIVVYDSFEAAAVATLESHIKKVIPTSQLTCIEHEHDPNTTFIAARNVGLNHIGDCRYIHFVNSDVELPEDFYEKATQGLANRQDCVATIPARVKLLNSLDTEIHSADFIENPWLWLISNKLEIAGAVLLSSYAVEKAGKFNPLLSIGADTDFFARISNQGAWHYIPARVITLPIPQTKADMQQQFLDYYRQWALVYENLLDTYRARARIARKIYRPILAKAWCEAGQELLSHRHIEEAHDCFRRSLSWQLFNPAFKYLIKISQLRKKASLSNATDT